MKLAQLFSLYPQLHWGSTADQDVVGISQDSRTIESGFVYVAVRGHQADGHQFISQAIAKGAIGLVVEDRAEIPEQYQGAVVTVSDSRLALASLASRFYGDPAGQMFCVGVTGTNGKTTVTYMIEHILNQYGWPTGVLGTIDHHLGEHVWKSQLTTPDPLVLQKRLSEFAALGAKAATFEVSSIAIDQHRADMIPFDVVVFTNFTRDHLDYHGDMETYFSCKQKLFSEIPLHYDNKSVVAVINSDDESGKKLQVAAKVKVVSYGVESADIKFNVKKLSLAGTEYTLQTSFGNVDSFLPVPGLHNLYNACAAIGVGLAAGMSLQKCCDSLSQFMGVPGRLQRVGSNPDSPKKDVHVFVDYAHTDDALKSVLNVLAQIRKGTDSVGRIITVFGCGGDRDAGKRSVMGAIAAEGSDFVFVTSDNPRYEDPQKIIDDILKGVPDSDLDVSIFTEVDRRKAIERALQMANADDVVLIAGKGHEDYQIIGDEVLDFCDYEVAKELLS